MDSEDETDLNDIFKEEDQPPPAPPTEALYQRSVNNASKEITIRLVGKHPLWGHHLWNAAKCFADFLDQNGLEFCLGRRILELGAGGALPSIISALNGAQRVVITDYPDSELIENIRVNVVNNLPPEIRLIVDVQGHTWGKDVKPLLAPLSTDPSSPVSHKFDVILLSDLIFNHSQHRALLQTCEAALEASHSGAPGTPCLLVFFTHHRPWLIKEDLAFFNIARERGWKTKKLLDRKMKAMFKNDPGDEDIRATVEGWQLYR